MTLIKIQKIPSVSKAFLRPYSQIGVLVDENTKSNCYPLLQHVIPRHQLIQVPAGEAHKNLYTCQQIWQRLTDQQFDRHSLLMVVGGGVLGDMGGFCAATYKRGIDFLLIPTTLLAQVDASIGGKLAVDFGPHKNHIGIFQQPIATLIATEFLNTLPERELRSGFAEIIKHCLIADKRMWSTIRTRSLETQDWLKLVKHSVNIKSLVVRKDPREKGLRKVLNYGHTIGHALEGHFLTSGNLIFHGEAIAAGMVMEAYVAHRKRLLSLKELQDISGYVLSIFGKIEIPAEDAWMNLIKQDKKNRGNRILMAVPKKIGRAVWDVQVNEKEILDAVDYYQSCQT